MDGWNDTILNTTSNIGLNYEKVNTVHTNKNIKTSLKYSTAQNLVHILYFYKTVLDTGK